MVGKWKRVLYSLIGVIVAIAIFGISIWIEEAIGRRPDPIGSFLFFCVVTLYLSVPGWILALPVVLSVSNIRGWRFWAVFAIGASIGPIVIYGIVIYTFLTSAKFAGFAPEAKAYLWLSLGVSSLTTLTYLCLLKRAQCKNLTVVVTS